MMLKIYGERNTGTNYLEQLLLLNLKYLPEKDRQKLQYVPSPLGEIISTQDNIQLLGWKHRYIESSFLKTLGIKKEEILIITLTKNPYSWLLSLHKRPYNVIAARQQVLTQEASGNPIVPGKFRIRMMRLFSRLKFKRFTCWDKYSQLTFQQFLREPWFTVFNEGCDTLKTPIELWNKKNGAYLELAKEYSVLSLTYEDLLAYPEKVVRNIFSHLGLCLNNFENISRSTKTSDQALKDNQYYCDFYINELWRNKLLPDDIHWINAQLDKEVMRAFKYAPLSM